MAALAADVAAAHSGVRVHWASVDMRDHEAMEKAVAAIPDDLKRIDILCNVAGLALGMDAGHAFDDADLVTMTDTNCVALARLTRLVAPGMAERDQGDIVNMSSVAAHYHYPGGAIYCACKGRKEREGGEVRGGLVEK